MSRALLILFLGMLLSIQSVTPSPKFSEQSYYDCYSFYGGSVVQIKKHGPWRKSFSNEYKVPVVVDPKPGASGFIAAQYVAKAAPDGYTLLYTTNTTHAANEHLFKKIPYDPVKDFTPVALLFKGYMFLLVNPKSNIFSLQDLLDLARKNPGKVNFASGSSSSRVASELLAQLTNIEVVHIPYKSNPPAVTDLLGGQFDFMFADASTAIPQIKAGKLRALAVSGTSRAASVPNVPTVEEAGVKGYDMSFWNAVYLPAGAPEKIVKQLNEMFVKASQTNEMTVHLSKTSEERVVTTPEGLAKFQAAESLKWGKVISSGILNQNKSRGFT
jgi:tripartite-type tricarboxylate transporter receptor subunit TctC